MNNWESPTKPDKMRGKERGKRSLEWEGGCRRIATVMGRGIANAIRGKGA